MEFYTIIVKQFLRLLTSSTLIQGTFSLLTTVPKWAMMYTQHCKMLKIPIDKLSLPKIGCSFENIPADER